MLTDPAMVDDLYENEPMRHFAGLKLGHFLDETKFRKFCHFPERHGRGMMVFKEVNKYLEKHGLIMCEGNIVDFTIISAPIFIKNESGQRDPEMR